MRNTMLTSAGVAVLGALVVMSTPNSARAHCDGPSVSVGDTSYCGYYANEAESVVALQGIKYATADRWAPPVPFTPPAGPVPADTYRSVCPQVMSYEGVSYIVGSEDCLYLNVWKPADADGTNPVMVFIHGGAFIFGSGSDGANTVKPDVGGQDHSASIVFDPKMGTYNGTRFAERGVVLVSLNYRLGAFGFLASNTVSPAVPANLGLRDQQTAMRWVADNIARFGGDPQNVTLFGESAGAMSTGLHMLGGNEESPTLFNRAIMESNPMGYYYKDIGQASKEAELFLRCAMDVHSGKVDPYGNDKKQCHPKSETAIIMSTVEAMSTYDLMRAQVAFGVDEMSATLHEMLVPAALPYTPVIDDDFLTTQPLGLGQDEPTTDKSYIFGTNANEGALFADLIQLGAQHVFHFFDHPIGVYDLFVYRDVVLERVFGKTLRNRIVGYSPNGTDQPYSGGDKSTMEGLNNAGAATAAVIDDFGFRCGNLYSANKVVTHAGRSADAGAVYGYLFQPGGVPFQVMAANAPACNANNKSGLDCHTIELPFVFDTFGSSWADPAVDKTQPAHFDPSTLSGGLKTLSNDVMSAWVAFAKTGDPAVGAFSNWKPFAEGAEEVLHIQQGSAAMLDTAPGSHCAGLWNGVYQSPPVSLTQGRSARGD